MCACFPKTSDFVIEASNSVRLQSGSVLHAGDIGALGAGAGPFLSGGVSIDTLAGAVVDKTQNLIANSVHLGSGAVVGDVQTAQFSSAAGSIHGGVTALVQLPALPAVSAVTAGTSNLMVGSGTVVASPGRYADVTVNAGSTLGLGPGLYEVASVTVGAGARVQALGAVQIHVAGRWSMGSGAFLGPASPALSASGIQVEVSGINGTSGTLSATPKAAAFGDGNQVQALVLVANGTLVVGTGDVLTGAFFARDVDVGTGSVTTFQDGFSSTTCGATSCDDSNPCTVDTCASGACAHAPVATGTSCSDGNACNGAETCGTTGQCGAGTPPTVDDANPCTVDACDMTVGVTHTPVSAGTSCSDGNACNGSETCNATGTCTAGTPPVVDDGNPCTVDTCDPATGVTHTPVSSGTSCSDGNACNGAETCSATGTCTAGTPPVIDDGNPCTADSCDPVIGVAHVPVAAGTSCSDGNACNGLELCDANGTCELGTPVAIDDGNPCTADSCDPATGAMHAPLANGAPCSDGNPCNGSEFCDLTGECLSLGAVNTDDGNPCTADACDPAHGITHAPLPSGTACGLGRTCDASGICQVQAGCSSLCSAVASANCGAGLDANGCQSSLCPGTEDATCAAPLSDLVSCAGSSPTVTCGGSSGFTVTGCDAKQFALTACQKEGRVATGATLCNAVGSAGCSTTGLDCEDVLDSQQTAVQCGDDIAALVACAGTSPAISCSGDLGFSVTGCEREAAAVHACQVLGGDVPGCADLCSAEAVANCGLMTDQCLGECATLPASGTCQTEFAALTACTGSTPTVTCTTGGSAPFTVVGCEQQLQANLACDAEGNPCPVFGDANPCTLDTCDPVNGPQHLPVAAGTSCGDNATCDGDGDCKNVPGCKTTCTAIAAAGCPGVFSESDCEASLCQGSTASSCGSALTALTTCAGSTPAVACGGPLGYTIQGCDTSALELAACEDGGPGATGCADLCTAVAAAGCSSETDCFNTCVGPAASAPCSSSLGALLQCAGSAPQVTCASGGVASFSVNGCATQVQQTFACATGACTPADDGNPCTVDTCDPTSGATTHTPAATGSPCLDNRVCDATGACVDIGGCDGICSAVVAAGCVPGLTQAACDAQYCSASASGACGSTLQELNQCAGVTPAVTCTPGGPAPFTVAGCDGAFSDLATCTTSGGCVAVDDGNPCTIDTCDPTTGTTHAPACVGTACGSDAACDGDGTCTELSGCPSFCSDLSGSGCLGLTQQDCVSEVCSAATGCDSVFAALDACAGPAPRTECTGELNFAVNGCEQQSDRAFVCAEAGPGAVPCVDLCASLTQAGCAPANCLATCAQATEAPGCADDWSSYFTCAGQNPQWECFPGQTLNVAGHSIPLFTANGCEDSLSRALTCTAGHCVPAPDGNPCTVDACDASGAPTHVITPGLPCNDHSVCDATGACVPATGSACLTACQGLAAAGCVDPSECPRDCNLATGACATQSTSFLGCAAASQFTSCDMIFGACSSQDDALSQCQQVCAEDDNPCTTVSCNCTADSCDPASRAIALADTGAPCASTDGTCNGTCTVGAGASFLPQCVTRANSGSCTGTFCTSTTSGSGALPDGTPCPDSDACNGVELCADGACTAGTPLSIDDGNPCTADACDPVSGNVTHVAVPDGTACPDNNLCNGTETCESGVCQASAEATPVDDGNPCTADACDPVKGVTHTPFPDGSACSDGNFCTTHERCTSGVCSGTPLDIDDGNPCTTDACAPASGAVTHVLAAAGTSCSDDNACNGLELCDASGDCLAGSAPVIDDGDPCTVDSCDPALGVTHTLAPAGASCSDGNFCNGAEICDSHGLCLPGTAPILSDNNLCTDDSCDPIKGVLHSPSAAGTSCADANQCNGTETCSGTGYCRAGTPLDSNDGNPCTIDSCNPATGVVHVAIADGTSCSDANACTTSDACAGGACTGQPVAIDDGNPCTTDACDPNAGVTHVVLPAGSSCSDGNVCNGNEVCSAAGQCQSGTPVATDDGDPCTQDLCDPLRGVSHPLAANGTVCGPSAYCNGADACVPVVPPDPATIAPPVNLTTNLSLLDRVSFLISGDHPIQTGVLPGTINPVRAAVVRGRVLDANNAPLSGVAVQIEGHPELGGTRTRADGMYDLVVNGGGQSIVQFSNPGFLTAQRKVSLPWNDSVVLEDVVLVAVDPVATVVTLGNPDLQVAAGSPVSDDDGTRQARVFFEPGTNATMVLPDGTSQPLDSITVHATEFTVGPEGPERMPGVLPAASGYTYAVELTADEAVAAGATTVTFDRAVPLYVENFLHFPVGTIVPIGTYDRITGCWVPQPNGVVIQILAVMNGLADLSVDGSGSQASDAELATMGITDAERQQLAQTYAPGTQLWRAPLSHWTGADANWPYEPDDPPGNGGTGSGGGPGGSPGPGPGGGGTGAMCNEPGSSLSMQDQTMGESLHVAGTNMNLTYRSDRVPGRRIARTINIPISGSEIGSTTVGFDLEVDVAGRTFQQSFPAEPNQNYVFEWDGQDAYGRVLTGSQPAVVRVGRIVPAVYAPPSDVANAFAQYSAQPNVSLTTDRARSEYIIWTTTNMTLGTEDARETDVAGWTVDVHHWYDPYGPTLYKGDGTTRNVAAAGAVMERFAGIPYFGAGVTDGVPRLYSEMAPTSVVAMANGDVYFSSATGVHRIDAQSGLVSLIMPSAGASCDAGSLPPNGASASVAGVCGSALLTGEQADTLLVADQVNSRTTSVPIPRLRRLQADGTMITIAGGVVDPKLPSNGCYSGDGGPATAATFCSIVAVASGPDCSVYVLDQDGLVQGGLRQIACDGTIRTLVPNLSNVVNDSNLDGGLAVGADGSVYFTQSARALIGRLSPDGKVSIVAGVYQAAGPGYSGDGGPATEALLALPEHLEIGPDGTLYFEDWGNFRLRTVSPSGIINTLVGTGDVAHAAVPDSVPAGRAPIGHFFSFTLAPDGSLLLSLEDDTIRRIHPPLPGGVLSADILIPSEDGEQVYEFDANGRHLRTRSALTGGTLFSFGYDSDGHLVSVTDGDGNQTTIQRDLAGNPNTIVGPYGHTTSLALDDDGFLSQVTDPAGAVSRFTYTPDGLMTQMQDARGGVHQFDWDPNGYIIRDQSPAGVVKNLTRTTDSSGFTVTRQTTLGVTATYSTETLPTGDLVDTNVIDDGLPIVRQRHVSTQTSTTTVPDGTTTTAVLGASARWGMVGPIATSTTLTTPSGVTLATADAQSVTTVNSDPFNLQSYSDSSAINGLQSVAAFTGPSKTETATSAAGRITTTAVDGQGRPLEVTTAGLAPVDFFYDPRGHLQAITQDTRTTTNAYDLDGNLASVTDALGQTETYDHDPVGRVTAHHRADGTVVGFGYDALGNLTSVTPPGKPSHLFSYTPDNRLESYTAPDTGDGNGPATTSYAYDLDGHPTEVDRADGSAVTMGYDSSGRMRTVTLPTGTETLGYSATTGRLTSATGPYGVNLAYAYDGKLLTGTTWSGAVSGSVARTYDHFLRVATETIDGDATTKATLGYDNDGLVTSVATPAGSMALTYDPTAPRLQTTTLGSVTDARTYDQFGEVASYDAKFGSSDLYSVSYARDALGRIQQKTETIQGTTTVTEYGYDQVGRLISVAENGAAVRTYAYDANGNRTLFTDVEHGTTSAGTYDAQDRLLTYGTLTYTYTKDGALRTKRDSATTPPSVTTYTYDALGNLTHVDLPDGRAIDYVVDGAGRRVGKKINGILVKQWLYADDLRIVAELDGSGNVVSRFVWVRDDLSSPQMYVVQAGQVYSEQVDQLGTSLLYVNAATGTAERHDVDEWGNSLGSAVSTIAPFGFAGGQSDTDTGLIHFVTRDYDPSVGRWIEKDPILFDGGDSNIYAYCYGDSINRVDASGADGYGTVAVKLSPNMTPVGGPSFTASTSLPSIPAAPSSPSAQPQPGDKPPPRLPLVPRPDVLPPLVPWPLQQPTPPSFPPYPSWPPGWPPPEWYTPPYCPRDG